MTPRSSRRRGRTTGGPYALEVQNRSGDLAAPADVAWSLTTVGAQEIDASLSADQTFTRALTAEGPGHLGATLSWPKGTHTVSKGFSGSAAAAASTERTVAVDAAGTLSASLEWDPTTKSSSYSASVGNLATHTGSTFAVTAPGTVQGTVTWSDALSNLDVYLRDVDTNQVVASSEGLTGTSEQVSHPISSASLSAPRRFRWEVVSKSTGAGFTNAFSFPVTADLDLELLGPSGTVVAQASSATAKPEALTYSIPTGATGTYRLRVRSNDHAATWRLDVDHPELAFASLTARLKDPGGAVVTEAGAASGALTIDHPAPAAGAYTLEVETTSTDVAATLSGESVRPLVRHADLDLSVVGPAGQTMGETSGTARPEQVSVTVPASGTGEHTLRVASRDFETSGYDLSVTYPTLALTTVTARLKDPSGAIVAEASDDDGSLAFEHHAAGAGGYTLEIENTHASLEAPAFDAAVTAPERRYGAMRMQLTNSSGAVVAQESAGRPLHLAAEVPTGGYTLVVTPESGAGTATVSAGAPSIPRRERITYDVWDHATVVDDGRRRVEETLAPSGRVLRRVVKHSVTGEVEEDVTFGYAGASDSPAYEMRGPSVTTYLGGASGILAIVKDGVATYPIANAEGDVVGTVGGDGAFTPAPLTDEWGVGPTPASRLGFLGDHQRYSVGGDLGLVRMGVRLLDPALGRFLSVDSIEGGTANDYAYVDDPVNEFDLAGTHKKKCRRWNVACNAHNAGHSVGKAAKSAVGAAAGAARSVGGRDERRAAGCQARSLRLTCPLVSARTGVSALASKVSRSLTGTRDGASHSGQAQTSDSRRSRSPSASARPSMSGRRSRESASTARMACTRMGANGPTTGKWAGLRASVVASQR